MGEDSNGDGMTAPKQGKIAKLLGAAVRFWLTTQVDVVDELEVTVGGTARELLSGCLPGVTVRATGVVYQGLALQNVAIAASKIKINLSQILRGKPLQLQEAIAIDLVQTLTAANLNQSITAPLLEQAIADFIRPLLATADPVPFTPKHLSLGENTLILQGIWHDRPLTLTTGLSLSNPHTLFFSHPKWTWDREAPVDLPAVENFEIDLGEDVAFRGLAIAPDKIQCEGTLLVRP